MLLSGHARRSRSAAATQRWMVSPRATFGIESAAAVRVCASYRTLPPDENDIEFVNNARIAARRVARGTWVDDDREQFSKTPRAFGHGLTRGAAWSQWF